MNGEVRIVDDVATAFAHVVSDEQPGTFALSGGSTARACYDRLARLDYPWERTSVYFGDERWVPVTDPDSNEGMARAELLDAVAPRSIHSMRGAGTTPEFAAERYGHEVAANGALDLVHLGLGPDGHTASLFPGSPALDVRDRWVVTTGDELHPHPRLTLTHPAIDAAGLVVFTVAGASKRNAFARVRAGADLPAANVRAARVVWLVDPAAADGS